MKNFLALLAITFLFLACKKEKPVDNENKLAYVENESKLIKTFKYSENSKPIISAHRGGKNIINYPENCLETIKFLHKKIESIFEVDIVKTKDGELVLMHDYTLDRTTTGSGKLINHSYQELLKYNLLDNFGNETTYKITLLKELLRWAKQNNIILGLDPKRTVGFEELIDLIRKEEVIDNCFILTYNIEQAKQVYNIAPELLISITVRNFEEFIWYLSSDIPLKNMLAFTGTRLSKKDLYENLHEKGLSTILGTLGNLDNMAAAKNDNLYVKWKEDGIDIFATDRPLEVAKIFQLEK